MKNQNIFKLYNIRYVMFSWFSWKKGDEKVKEETKKGFGNLGK